MTTLVLPATLLTASLLGFVLVILSMRIIAVRRSAHVSMGDGGNKELLTRIRSHANFAEYAPITLVLLALVEAGGWGLQLVLALGLLFVAARISHAIGMPKKAPNPWRFGGMVATFLIIAILSVLALITAVQAL